MASLLWVSAFINLIMLTTAQFGGQNSMGGASGAGAGTVYGAGTTPTTWYPAPEAYGSTPSVPTFPVPSDGGSSGGPTDGLPVPTYGGGSAPVYGTPITLGPVGGHGTCKFWSSNFGSWPNILSTISTVSSAFGDAAGGYLNSMFGGGMTLLQALQNMGKDPFSSLMREATASLLNSYAYKGRFPFTPEMVKAKFGAALFSATTAAALSAEFGRANAAI